MFLASLQIKPAPRTASPKDFKNLLKRKGSNKVRRCDNSLFLLITVAKLKGNKCPSDCQTACQSVLMFGLAAAAAAALQLGTSAGGGGQRGSQRGGEPRHHHGTLPPSKWQKPSLVTDLHPSPVAAFCRTGGRYISISQRSPRKKLDPRSLP